MPTATTKFQRTTTRDPSVPSAWRTLALLLAGVFSACTTPPLEPGAVRPTVPAEFPHAHYRAAHARGQPVLRLDPERSLVVVHVYRGGRLALFGHDHVVASRDIHGYVLFPPDLTDARADLYVVLNTLSVDEAGLRAQAGFETTPTADDIAGTRRNMLDKTLVAHHFPFAVIQLRNAAGDLPVLRLQANIELHGRIHRQEVPVTIDTGGDELRAQGHFALLQTDFGITPLSILGGALQVQDRVEIAFDLIARRF